jgi:hypothetical protein
LFLHCSTVLYYTLCLRVSDIFAKAQAELRANVFQAIEEQDREAENNGASSFALLGKCSERAKQLHASHAGTSPVPQINLVLM